MPQLGCLSLRLPNSRSRHFHFAAKFGVFLVLKSKSANGEFRAPEAAGRRRLSERTDRENAARAPSVGMPAVRRKTRATHAASDAKADDRQAKLAALVEELDLEVEAKCQSLQSDTERMISSLRAQFKMQLAKLPKKIQQMTVADFFAATGAAGAELEVPELRELADKYGATGERCDREVKEPAQSARKPLVVVNNDNGTKTVLRSTRKAARTGASILPQQQQQPDAPMSTRRATRATGIVAATPAPSSKTSSIVAQTPAFNPNLPYTPAVNQKGAGIVGSLAPSTSLRLPRRGESIMVSSMHGDKELVMDSDASAQMIMDGENKIAALAISGKDGDINIADPTVCAALPKNMKLKAAQNVLAMQAQLEAMLANLQ